MGVAAGATRAGMPEEAASYWQAFAREDSVGDIGIAQIVESDIAWQASAASDAVPETVDRAARTVEVSCGRENIGRGSTSSQFFQYLAGGFT